MRWGRKFGKKWGWASGAGTLPQTVEVMIVNGVFVPCRSCHWVGVCVVPIGKHLYSYEKQRIRHYYQCEDFVNRGAAEAAEWDK